MTDRERTRRDAEWAIRQETLEFSDLARNGASWGRTALALLAELEQAERERDGAQLALESNSPLILDLQARLAKVPPLVEALKAIGEVAFVANEGDPWYAELEGVDTERAYRLYREALAAWENDFDSQETSG